MNLFFALVLSFLGAVDPCDTELSETEAYAEQCSEETEPPALGPTRQSNRTYSTDISNGF